MRKPGNDADIDSVLQELVRQIVATVHPLRIILFGSAARNDISPDSDIDLLIVVPEGTHRRRVAQQLYREIAGIGIPYDLVVATPDDIARHRHNIGLIYRSALQEGREVYAA